jgi:ribonuclease P protein component
VLPKNARLTTPADFARATKSGIRSSTESFVGYLYIQPAPKEPQPRAGLIVGKSAGGSVARHRLSRKLRHLIAPELSKFPKGSLLVIRALAQKNGVTSVENQTTQLFSELLRKSERIMKKAEM